MLLLLLLHLRLWKPKRHGEGSQRMYENLWYREMNAGKFPTASEAMKDVGGSYYVIRDILQELKYNSKMSSVDSKKTSVEKSANYVGRADRYREMIQKNAGKFPTASEAMKDVGGYYYVIREILQELKSIKKEEISTNTREVSQARDLGELISPISKVDIGDSSSSSIKSNQHPQSSILVESDGSKDVGTQSRRPTDSSSESSKSDQRPQSSISVKSDESKDVGAQSHCPIDEPKSSLHFDPENNKQETVDEDKKTFDESQSKDEPQESTEASGRELLKAPTEDAEHKTKSLVWQNLKSFANGILGIWKRS